MKYEKIRNEAFKANMKIPENHLALYTWGNVSAYDAEEKVLAIKPSGVPYEELTPESMVIVDLEGNVVDGDLNPSSDTPTHAVLYKEFAAKRNIKIGGIIHTHSTFAVSWAQAVQSVPLFGTTHADHIQTKIPCTPYLSKEAVEKDYEKETGNLIISHFDKEKLNPAEVNMVLCGGHGPFAWGETASKAVYNATVMEEICKMAINTLLVNPKAKELPDYIINKHYMRKHGPNAYYGQKK